MSIIKHVCAWCNMNLGETDGEGQEGTSHGICDNCKGRFSQTTKIQEPVKDLNMEELERQVEERLRFEHKRHSE